MPFETKSQTPDQLLRAYAQIIDELRDRKIVRTANSPIGDYAEWLVANRLGLTLTENSNAGYDAFDQAGTKYQIKGRRITRRNPSKQLSAIRNLDKHDFDYLIAVLFDEQVEVTSVLKIPHAIIATYARYREHVNAYILVLGNAILRDTEVEDLTAQFRQPAQGEAG